MSDKLIPQDGGAYQGEVENVTQTERMGRDYVKKYEGPLKPAMAMGADGKAVNLPWSTGKPVGQRAKESGLIAVTPGPEGDERPQIHLTLDSTEEPKLERGMAEATVQGRMSEVDGSPQVDQFDEQEFHIIQDAKAMEQPLPPRCPLKVGDQQCILHEGHGGNCFFDTRWPVEDA